jgi:hypothetical protein
MACFLVSVTPCELALQVFDTIMNPDTRLTIPPQVISRLVGEETVLLDLESGTYFGLDGVGKRIWDAVGEGLALAEIVDIIVAEYAVDEATARTDIEEFVRILVKRGLLAE